MDSLVEDLVCLLELFGFEELISFIFDLSESIIKGIQINLRFRLRGGFNYFFYGGWRDDVRSLYWSDFFFLFLLLWFNHIILGFLELL